MVDHLFATTPQIHAKLKRLTTENLRRQEVKLAAVNQTSVHGECFTLFAAKSTTAIAAICATKLPFPSPTAWGKGLGDRG
jgi:hypothetical protein